MKCPVLIWSCQGAVEANLVKLINSNVKIHSIKTVASLETRISRIKANRVIKWLGFENSHKVEA